MRRTIFLAAPLALALGGCGGSNAPQPLPPVQTPSQPVAQPDPFVAQVAQLVASQPEDAEPAALDASAPTMPEDSEPGALAP
jgi:hypothetical protein